MEVLLYGERPMTVMEARTVKDVPGFLYQRQKVALPFQPNDRLKGSMIYVLNTSVDGIVELLDNRHPLFSNMGNVYNTYYYDFKTLRGSIQSDKVTTLGIKTPEAKAERATRYGLIKTKREGTITPIRLDLARGKNLIYDLQPVVDLVMGVERLKKMNFMVRCHALFDTLYHHYQMPLEGYQKGVIFVNLDDFPKNATLDSGHIFLYLLTLFTRSDNALAPFRYPMEFLFYTKAGYLKFNMKTDLIKQNLSRLRSAITRMKPQTLLGEKVIDQTIEKVIKAEITNAFNVKMGLTGDASIDPDDEIADTLKDTIRRDLDEEGEVEMPEDEAELVDDIEEEMEKDPIMKEEVIRAITKKKVGSASEASLKRDQMLREKQRAIKIKTKTLGELKGMKEVPPVKEHTFQVPEVLNEEIKKVKFDHFSQTYNETLLEKDIANTITLFNDKTINVNVTDVKVEDTSDVMKAQDTYTISMEDENRKRHTVTINVPKFIDDQFMFMNGNKRFIKYQFVPLPVLKTSEDAVQVCSACYNKIFIYRVGSRFNPNMEKFKKILLDEKYQVSFRKGNNANANKTYLTCLEYDEMASHYTEIVLGNCHFLFNMQQLNEIFHGQYASDMGKCLIGYRAKGVHKEPLWYDRNNEDHIDLISTMILEGRPDLYEDFKAKGFGRKYIYARATIMAKKVPLVVLLSFFEGLTEVIRKFDDPSVQVVEKKSNRDNYMYIPFANGYLQYPMSNIEACILFNGLTEIPTAQYQLSDLDERETYIDIFQGLFGSSYCMGGFLNYYDFMIDPITLEVLQALDYPEDFVSLMIYASRLLADKQHQNDMDLSLYRLRSNEVVPALMYKELTKAYARYRKTQNSKSQAKLSVDPDCIFKALNEIPTVTDYSKLNPILEYRELHCASTAGYVGMNLEESYTEEKRIYHDTMRGIVGASTDSAKNTGKERHLVVEPNVINARGMLQLTDSSKTNDLDFTKLETGIELFVPGGLRHDDERRTAMAVKQKGHLLPVRDQSPLLMTNGMDSMIHYRTSDEFSVVAKEDGVVKDYDPVSKTMIVEYKSGKRKAIDLSMKQVKNGGGGMYLRNQMMSSFKPGDTFKEGAILAYDKYFYQDSKYFGNRLSVVGTLVKSVCISHPSTLEDSTWFTSSLSRRMAADISMPVEVFVGKNSTVDFIVKPGDEVKIGDPLIKFETSYEQDELNTLLSTIRDDLQEEIINLGKNSVTSHYAGVVDDVVVFSAVDLDQLSPSLRKIANESYKQAKSKRKMLEKYDNGDGNKVYKLGLLMDKPEGKVEPDRYGKIAGRDVADGVMIRFFVTYHDELSDGDKLVHMTANKATCGFKIPDGYEPRTAFRPYEEISIPVAPSAVLQRGTPTILPDMCVYKLLIETKRKQYEILTGEDWNEKMKRENPYMILREEEKPVEESVLEFCNVLGQKILSEGMYQEGDVLFEGELATKVYHHLLEHDGVVAYRDYNVKYNGAAETLVACEAVYPGESLRAIH